ncbi:MULTISPECIES: hypothetical protein [Treponema]|uniref:Uncharacterized protein n=1 Tax=Treponema denticola (strain ATCC 35405 / DSM 14222 / CIP 103919 / JCM 8153 / KCTC 15104) TaxID=243275 RepID=Q73QK0_TREDE|nr:MULTISPECIES: hypothetical protein [Treponema]UTC88680.1 hypothetical protein E4N79_11280 [Treponema denticola]AAS10938.1 hypothetical protein TDE_0443 [Treponema denticola ATCC 35405]EMB35100.1 hypothetical protein HMPREF9721_01861 [Treponema denticola ATCC 35404]EMB35794.1 hypothetical protein HMPREF9735_02504 [Treponema denticola ATCC 33521]HCY95084.1 hypothetical protein [Treponema sp.]
MWNFFTNIKEKFSGINKNYSEKVLNSYTAKLVQVLQSIDNHIEYEIELANNVGLKQDILDKYDPVKYIIELDTQILKKIKNSEKTFYGFYKKAIFLDLSGFKHVNEKIYSELLYRMFEMSASNKNMDVNKFIREFYAYCNKNSFAYAGEEIINRLKKYLQLAEPYIIKTKYEDSSQEDFRSNSGQQENTDFFAETKEDAYGVKLIIDLLFQYNIEDMKSLNKMLKKAGWFHFFVWITLPSVVVILALIAACNDYDHSIYIGIILICAIIVLINSILFAYMSAKIEYLKKSIMKIAIAAKIGENYIYSSLKDQYGKKIKKLLKWK